jgi:Family of unknown function (DUF6338)
MQFSSGTTVLLTAAFLMPGFVWSAVLSMFLSRRANQTENRFLEFFTLSCINNSIWFALFVYFALDGYFFRNPLGASIWLFVALFVSPVLLGVTSAKLAQTDLLAKLLRRLGFRTVNYIKSAWDWHFSRQQSLWAVVTLRDGSVVYGRFGPSSFAGDDPKDIYLEKIYKQENHGFTSTEDNYGILILAEQIATIEFYRETGGEND